MRFNKSEFTRLGGGVIELIQNVHVTSFAFSSHSQSKSSRRKRRSNNGLLSAVALASSLLFNTTAIASELYVVESVNFPKQITFDGVVKAVNQGTVAAQTSGTVIGVSVDVNDRVSAGDVLLQISSVQQSASLSEAQAALTSAQAANREAQAQVRRFRELFPKGAVSQDQMDAAEARAKSTLAGVRSANAAVEKAKEALGYTSITAPYAGIVTARHVELGETVSPGMPLLSGFADDLMRVEVAIPQSLKQQVKNLEQFSIFTSDNEAEVLKPEAMNLFEFASNQSHSYQLRLELPASAAPLASDQLVSEQSISNQLINGQWVKVRFDYGTASTLLIPKTAVFKAGNVKAVYRQVSDNKRFTPVKLGASRGDWVEVVSGLKPGDVIHTTPFSSNQ